MALLWPLLLVAAFLVARERARQLPPDAGAGCRWFWGWAVAGALMSFSFVTGFSIGLFVLPAAAVALLAASARSPRIAEALGFLAGVGVTLAAIGMLNPGVPVWFSSAAACIIFGLAGYAVLRAPAAGSCR